MRVKSAISLVGFLLVLSCHTLTAQANASSTPGYVLHRGDELSIKVFHFPELDQNVRVRPDGKISLQILNDVQAEGVTPNSLADQLSTRYAEFFKEPKVAVIVNSFSEQKVFVGGEVGQPALIPLIGDMTVMSAVIQAGGFRPTARKNQVIVIRNDGKGGRLVQTVDLNNPKNGATVNMRLEPFDVVYVPQSRIAKVDQFVDQYVRQLIPATLNAGFTYLGGNNGVVIGR